MTKERSRRYFAQTITDADYVDDIALQVNTPAQSKPCYIVWICYIVPDMTLNNLMVKLQ